MPVERLVWTGALLPGYRPQKPGPEIPFTMTAIMAIAPTPSGGTTYTATVLHGDPDARRKHEAMGFHQGWSTALDQLVALHAG